MKKKKIAVNRVFGDIDGLKERLEKKYGENTIYSEDSETNTNVKFIPTGILSLDCALGGGFPAGRVIEIFGPESSGKTGLALHAIAVSQRFNRPAMIVDAEYAFDNSYARAFGVDIDKLLINQPDCGEQALDVVEETVKSKVVNLIVVDSVAALTPKAEIEGQMGDSHMGLQARMMSQALRKLTGIISKTDCTVIFINQLRMKIGVMWGNPETTTGGNALKFYASQRIDVRRIEFLPKDNPKGIHQRIKVVKNKVAPPHRETELNLYFKTGYDVISDIMDMAINFDIIHKAPNSYTFNGERIAKNEAECREWLRTTSKENRSVIRKQIKEAYNK